MTQEPQDPQQPEQPAAATRVPSHVVSATQGVLDQTFNLHTTSPLEDVEAHLRGALADAGVEDLPPGWVEDAAARIRAGEPVAARPAEEGEDEIAAPPATPTAEEPA